MPVAGRNATEATPALSVGDRTRYPVWSMKESKMTSDERRSTNNEARVYVCPMRPDVRSFVMEAARVGGDTVLAQIVDMVSRRAAEPRTDSKRRRPRRRILRTRRARGRVDHVRGLGLDRSEAAVAADLWSRGNRLPARQGLTNLRLAQIGHDNEG